jgi:hypothetical protein
VELERYTASLLRNFNANVGREDIKQATGDENVYETSTASHIQKSNVSTSQQS